MNKFLNLCEKVERYLKEQEMGEEMGLAPNAPTQPGQPVAQNSMLDPNTQSEVKDVSNDKIHELISTIVDFYQKGKALTSDSVEQIAKLPSTINATNSEETVDNIIYIFTSSNFPSDSSGTNE